MRMLAMTPQLRSDLRRSLFVAAVVFIPLYVAGHALLYWFVHTSAVVTRFAEVLIAPDLLILAMTNGAYRLATYPLVAVLQFLYCWLVIAVIGYAVKRVRQSSAEP